jgi:transcriptional regulator with XRE-family HTH domain
LQELTGGERLRECRALAELSQEEFARKLSSRSIPVSNAAVSKWEKGKSVPRFQTQYKIDRYFTANLPDIYRSGELIGLWKSSKQTLPVQDEVPFSETIGTPQEATELAGDPNSINEPPKLSSRRTTLIGFTAVLAAIGLVALFATTRNRTTRSKAETVPTSAQTPNAKVDVTDPQRYGTGRIITIDNRVVLNETDMREDLPAYLSSRTELFCDKKDCKTADTGLATGDRARALCQTIGDNVTNRFGNTPNANNADSSLWYLVVDRGGRTGYLSEVWVTKTQRGGLGLPTCVDDTDILSPPAPPPPTTTGPALIDGKIVATTPVNIMAAPSIEGPPITTLTDKAAIRIECSFPGDPIGQGKYPKNATWNRIRLNGSILYVADVYTDTKGDGQRAELPNGGYYLPTNGIPQCG